MAGSRRLRWRRPLLGIGIACIISVLFGYGFANPLLFVEGGPRNADVIIVLGGDVGERAFQALELYKSGCASNVLVSGTGDCYFIRDRLALGGVATNALFVEPDSRNTQENAAFSVRWMEQRGMKSAIVVTSWWHSRRALSCFRRFGSQLELSSYPAYHGLDMNDKPTWQEAPFVMREYCALGWYVVRHGILPARAPVTE